MVKDIDDLADDVAGSHESPGSRFRETFLSKRPTSQWPSYIDETAVDLGAGIGIGTTQLDPYNFPVEVGPFYRRGMVAAAGRRSDISDVLEETVSSRDLGTIVYQLNQLGYEIKGRDTGLDNVQHAIEAVIEKLLTQETGVEFSTAGQSETRSMADVVMEMFAHDAVAEQADTLVDEFEDSLKQGLLARLDEPQMMTPLWDHQLDALETWKDAGYRGYADMATATGKTVLGLAAIALRYGGLHPADDLEGQRDTSSKDRILIVAHSDLILEQWRREFDRHLNIPEERTHGSDDIELRWGRIHFRTPQRLSNQSSFPYDLVVLDEAHHYAAGGDWGELLDEFEEDVLALSGSVDDAGADSQTLQERLSSRIGPEVKRYSIAEAQDDGIIPAFDWEIRYAPFEADDELEALSDTIDEAYEAVQDRVDDGEIDVDRELRTFDQIRTFSHTTQGKELKRSDRVFKELSTGVFSRRTKRWHLSPRMEALTEVVVEHSNDHVVVLVDNNAQVPDLAEQLRAALSSASVVTVTSEDDRAEIRDQVDAFDAAEDGGVLVGTGDLLGEGVDIPHANVAVNMATGGVNPQLVQRIGRVLRNPEEGKHAHFYNVVGIPHAEAAIPHEDGRRLLEDAAAFCALGDQFNNLPAFAVAGLLEDDVLTPLLQAGHEEIQHLRDTDQYERPTDPTEWEHLRELLAIIADHEESASSVILGEWSEYSWVESADDDDADTDASEDQPRELDVIAETPAGDPVPDASLGLSAEGEDVEFSGTGPGAWQASIPPAIGPVTVRLSHPDYDDWEETVELESAQHRIRAELEASQPSTETGPEGDAGDRSEAVELQALSAGGDPLAQAAVSVTAPDAETYTRTDEAGRAVIESLPTGETVTVAVHHRDSGVSLRQREYPWDEVLTMEVGG